MQCNDSVCMLSRLESEGVHKPWGKASKVWLGSSMSYGTQMWPLPMSSQVGSLPLPILNRY